MQTVLLVGYWWLLFVLISFSFYPLSKLFFGKLVDEGWLVAKMVGWLILTYTAYLLGIFHLTVFNQYVLWVTLAVFLFLNWFGIRKFSSDKNYFKNNLRKIFLGEGVFFTLMLLMAFIRGFSPDIYGLEKYMDYGFVQSILNSAYFPPHDQWWAGGFINYYYFGHLQLAYLIKFSGVAGAYGFNLALALIFGLSGSLIFTFVRSWTKSIWPALLGAFLHLGIGNLQFITSIFSLGWKDYWYPSASRLVPGIINEFPVYSFVVSDIHAHVLNMPTDLLVLGFLVEIFSNKLLDLKVSVFLGFLLGICFMTNAWDLPIYGLVAGVVFGAYFVYYTRSYKDLYVLLRNGLLILLVAVLTLLPFWLYFIKVPLPVLPAPNHGPLYQLFQLWGFWLILSASFWGLLVLIRRQVTHVDLLVAALLATAIVLIIIPEFVYVKDIYGAPYQRSNTVFKLTFQAWNIFGMLSGYVVWRIVTAPGRKILWLKSLWVALLVLGILATGAYTVRAYLSGYGDFKTYKGLDGEKFITTRYGSEYLAAISWLRNNTPGDSIVVEAAGDSYSDFNFISSFTGRATIVGWSVHEWLWRGSFDPVGVREGEVNTLFTSKNKIDVQKIIDKYHVGYVVVGNLERQKYSGAPGKGLKDITKEVFHQGTVSIFQIK